jgi:hypothetical protein
MNATTTNARNIPAAWFLCTITAGLDLDGYRQGHHVYASVTPDGRVFVLAKGGRRVTFKTMADAARHLARVRGQDGRAVRVARQEYQWERWFEGRTAAA